MRTIKEIVRRDIDHQEIRRMLKAADGNGKKISFQHLVISDFDFSGFVLERAEFYNSVLSGCCFEGADLAGAMLGELKAAGTDFRSVIVTEGDIVWSDLRHSRFTKAKLERVYFFNTNLFNVSFRDADLDGANFLYCDLTHADFTGAYVERAQFVGCTLEDIRGLEGHARAYHPVMFSDRTW